MSLELERHEAAHSLPANLLEAAEESLQKTYWSICGDTPQREDGKVLPRDQFAVSGMISFVGDIDWAMVLCLPRDMAVALSERFMGQAIDFDSTDMNDLAGELANIIAGDVKARLGERGIDVDLSLPTVVKGRGVEVFFSDEVQTVNLLFQAREGAFVMTLAAPTSPIGAGQSREED
ncbi:MAG: chemotaxis protein CheX [Candidatus Krumholzibacteriota bacterium]|nr:chemotaxis protein CheX [Candidatus Krumholzibacteriota bacterium]